MLSHQLQIDVSSHVFRGPGDILGGADGPFFASVGSGQSQGSGRRRRRAAINGERGIADVLSPHSALHHADADAVIGAGIDGGRDRPGVAEVGDGHRFGDHYRVRAMMAVLAQEREADVSRQVRLGPGDVISGTDGPNFPAIGGGKGERRILRWQQTDQRQQRQ